MEMKDKRLHVMMITIFLVTFLDFSTFVRTEMNAEKVSNLREELK